MRIIWENIIFGIKSLSANKLRTFLAMLGIIIGVLLNSLTYSKIVKTNENATCKYSNETLLETRNSIYGNLAVTERDQQKNFYQNGLEIG